MKHQCQVTAILPRTDKCWRQKMTAKCQRAPLANITCKRWSPTKQESHDGRCMSTTERILITSGFNTCHELLICKSLTFLLHPHHNQFQSEADLNLIS